MKKEPMMQIIETDTLLEISGTGVRSIPLLDAGKARTLLLILDGGQAVAPCHMPCLVLYYFLEGQGQLRIEEEQAEYRPGTTVSVPAGVVRSISADRS